MPELFLQIGTSSNVYAIFHATLTVTKKLHADNLGFLIEP